MGNIENKVIHISLSVISANEETNMNLLLNGNPFGDPGSKHYLEYCGGKEWLPLVSLWYPNMNEQAI